MIQLLSLFKYWKIAALGAVVLGAWYGFNQLKDWHEAQIREAIILTQLQENAKLQIAVDAREKKLQEASALERAALQEQIEIEKKRVNNLQRMLLIDHDLDRLLQRKPGLILPRVNEGTAEVLQELEALTQ